MSEQPPSLSKGFFGYRRSAVNQMLSDRDVMLRQAEGRVRAAEAKTARLETELASLQDANARLQEQIQALEGRPREPGEGSTGIDITTRFLNEELATILNAAEESASRIIERARASTQQQVAEAERVWREAQGQIARFASWRDKVDPVLRNAQTKIDEVRTRIEEVPDQIRQALSPLAEAVASLDGDLAEVSGASGPPLILAPGRGVEAQAFVDEGGSSEPAERESGAGGFSLEAMVIEVDAEEGGGPEEGEGTAEGGFDAETDAMAGMGDMADAGEAFGPGGEEESGEAEGGEGEPGAEAETEPEPEAGAGSEGEATDGSEAEISSER